MGNNGFLTGILVACCLLLVGAIALTWAEMSDYTGLEAPTSAAAVATTEAGGAEVAETSEPTGIITLAPAGTVLVVRVDASKIVESGVLEKSQQLQALTPAMDSPVEPEQVKEVAIFVAVDETDLEKEPAISGVALLTVPVSEVEEALAASSVSSLTVEGLEAYQLEQGFCAVAGEDTLLFGKTEEALAQVARTHKSGEGALTPALYKALQKHADMAISVGAVVTDKMRAKMAEQTAEAPQVPPYVLEITGGGAGIDFDSDTIIAAVTGSFESDEAARQASEDANAKLSQMKTQFLQQIEAMKGSPQGEQMAAAMQPWLDLLDGIQISSTGPDFSLDMSVNLDELVKAAGAVVRGMMMMSAMSGMEEGSEGIEEELP